MLATLAELKTYLGISTTDQDTLLTLFINGANQMVLTFLGRNIEATDYEETIDGNAQLFYMLKNIPVNIAEETPFVISKNTGTISEKVWEELSEDDYSVSIGEGRINFFVPLSRGFQNYKIEYNAGYTAVPSDLKLATLKIASKYYNTRQSDGVSSESVAGDSIAFDVSQIPNDILAILSNYREM